MNMQEIINAAQQLPLQQQKEILSALQNNVQQQIEILSDDRCGDDASVRQRRMEWLKANREEYAGQYVALSGDQLVGVGASFRQAREQARANGVENPFLVRLESEQTILPAGW